MQRSVEKRFAMKINSVVIVVVVVLLLITSVCAAGRRSLSCHHLANFNLLSSETIKAENYYEEDTTPIPSIMDPLVQTTNMFLRYNFMGFL